MKKIPVSVIIPVKNEEKNLPECLARLSDFSEVVVVDSHSTDNTPGIVAEYGCRLVEFSWNGQFPKKRNWVLRNVPLENEWVLFLDADEFLTESFIDCVRKKIQQTTADGYWIYYDDYFMGRQLKHGVKMRKLALFKKSKGEYEHIDEKTWSELDMEIHEHPVINGRVEVLPAQIVHRDYKGVEHYIAKHNSYSTWEAHRFIQTGKLKSQFTFRQKVKYALLDSWLLGIIYFFYSYFIRGGIWDGKAGLIFGLFKMQYFFHIKCKINELKRWNVISMILLFLGLNIFQGKAESDLYSLLQEQGFENISIGNTENTDWIAFEDRVNRNGYDGIAEVVQIVMKSADLTQDVDIILLRNRLPFLKCNLSKAFLLGYREGEISLKEVLEGMSIVYNTDNYRKGQKKGKVVNSSFGKIDLVVYPQIALANYRFDKLYIVDIRLAPAVEMPLWPGAMFTGQVIFPIYNNLKGEVDYIRPGILALSQWLRLNDNVFGCLSGGNFTENRMGVNAELRYYSNEGRWGIGARAGLTGSSTFYGGNWEVSHWKRVDYAVNAFFYEPAYQIQFDVIVGQYVYGDRGGRLDCTRHFGDVLVGVFAMYSGKEVNGGFHFSIPLPGRRRRRSKSFPVRVMLPEYFDWEYEAQTGPEYKKRRLGRAYKTNNENRDAYRLNPLFIKSRLENN